MQEFARKCMEYERIYKEYARIFAPWIFIFQGNAREMQENSRKCTKILKMRGWEDLIENALSFFCVGLIYGWLQDNLNLQC